MLYILSFLSLIIFILPSRECLLLTKILQTYNMYLNNLTSIIDSKRFLNKYYQIIKHDYQLIGHCWCLPTSLYLGLHMARHTHPPAIVSFSCKLFTATLLWRITLGWPDSPWRFWPSSLPPLLLQEVCSQCLINMEIQKVSLTPDVRPVCGMAHVNMFLMGSAPVSLLTENVSLFSYFPLIILLPSFSYQFFLTASSEETEIPTSGSASRRLT